VATPVPGLQKEVSLIVAQMRRCHGEGRLIREPVMGGHGITRERVKGALRNRNWADRLYIAARLDGLPHHDAPATIGQQSFLPGEESCRIHCIEQNVGVAWRTNVAALRQLASQAKLETTFAGQSMKVHSVC
jgi:hypothetical protein